MAYSSPTFNTYDEIKRRRELAEPGLAVPSYSPAPSPAPAPILNTPPPINPVASPATYGSLMSTKVNGQILRSPAPLSVGRPRPTLGPIYRQRLESAIQQGDRNAIGQMEQRYGTAFDLERSSPLFKEYKQMQSGAALHQQLAADAIPALKTILTNKQANPIDEMQRLNTEVSALPPEQRQTIESHPAYQGHYTGTKIAAERVLEQQKQTALKQGIADMEQERGRRESELRRAQTHLESFNNKTTETLNAGEKVKAATDTKQKEAEAEKGKLSDLMNAEITMGKAVRENDPEAFNAMAESLQKDPELWKALPAPLKQQYIDLNSNEAPPQPPASIADDADYQKELKEYNKRHLIGPRAPNLPGGTTPLNPTEASAPPVATTGATVDTKAMPDQPSGTEKVPPPAVVPPKSFSLDNPQTQGEKTLRDAMKLAGLPTEWDVKSPQALRRDAKRLEETLYEAAKAQMEKEGRPLSGTPSSIPRIQHGVQKVLELQKLPVIREVLGFLMTVPVGVYSGAYTGIKERSITEAGKAAFAPAQQVAADLLVDVGAVPREWADKYVAEHGSKATTPGGDFANLMGGSPVAQLSGLIIDIGIMGSAAKARGVLRADVRGARTLQDELLRRDKRLAGQEPVKPVEPPVVPVPKAEPVEIPKAAPPPVAAQGKVETPAKPVEGAKAKEWIVTTSELITIGGRKTAEPVERSLTVQAKSKAEAIKSVRDSGVPPKNIKGVEPAETSVSKAKEPWQMTRAEWLTSPVDRADIGVRNAKPNETVSEYANRQRYGPEDYPHHDQMHEIMIGNALREGRPVPPEVLAEYPDLAKKKPVGVGAIENTTLYGGIPLPEIVRRSEAVSKAAGEGWRKVLGLPAKWLNDLRDTGAGTLVETVGSQFSDVFARPVIWSARKAEVLGRLRLARLTAEKVAHEYNTLMKKEGLDATNPETHIIAEKALRGEYPIEKLPDALKAWVANTRAIMDAGEARAANVFEKIGLTGKAMTYRENIGKYLINVSKRSVEEKRTPVRSFLARLVSPRLSSSWNKYKRDKWTVVVNGKPTKFETELEARQYATNIVEQKKTDLVTKRGQAKEWTLERSGKVPKKGGGFIDWAKTEEGKGVEGADLYRQAARRVEVVPPLSAEWRLREEIHDPRYLAAESILKTEHEAYMAEYLDYTAKKWGKNAPEGMLPEEVKSWAESNKLTQLPEAESLHTLKGVYLPKTMAADLMEMVRMPSEIGKMYRSGLAIWKWAKTAANAATHVRNVMGNFVFSYVGRASVWNPMNFRHYAEAVKELKARGVDYESGVKHGNIGTEFFGGELHRLETKLVNGGPSSMAQTFMEFFPQQKAGIAKASEAIGKVTTPIGNVGRAVHNTTGYIYALEDQVFKMAAYKKYRAEGMSERRAWAEVDRWYPNYSRTSRITRIMRQSPIGAPFISFVDQSIRIGGRAAKHRPIRLAMILALPEMITRFGVHATGMSPEEKKMLDETRSYFEPIVGTKDDWGRADTVDLRYIMPMANDILPQVKGGMLNVPWLLSTPVATAAVEQISGRERFTGRQKIKEGMTTGEQLGARAKMAFGALAPVPTGAMYGPERIGGAITGERRETLARAILGTLIGINIRSPYVAQAKVSKLLLDMDAEGMHEEARNVLNVWNKSYRAPGMPKLTPNRAGSDVRRQLGVYEHLWRAAEKGDEAGVKKWLDTHRQYGGDTQGLMRSYKDRHEGWTPEQRKRVDAAVRAAGAKK